MLPESILITGGAGFVGSSLAIRLKNLFPKTIVIALDNLHRRGSELNLPRLREAEVQFYHGDVRCAEDLAQLPDFDTLIDCAAEPSVQTGVGGSPKYVLNNNLVGTINCLEEARIRRARFMLISTSRVYPIEALNELTFTEEETRFYWTEQFSGINETFPLEGARSFYGTSKLAGELLLQEYCYGTQMPALINRCGVLAGPWQMGRIDQGVITLWVAHHYFKKPLRYLGYGGRGKQVRDILHIDDLFDLILLQLLSPTIWDGRIYNIGGGNSVSVSLRELTELCTLVSGNVVPIDSVSETRSNDLRIYISDCRKVGHDLGWSPKRSSVIIIQDILKWIDSNHEILLPILG